MDHPYTYVFVRQDISFEQQLVQSNHAALEAGFHFDKPEKTSSIVLIGARDQSELLEIGQRLDRHGIPHKAFFEPDFGPMGYTAIATKPLHTKEERRLMSKYRLYNFQQGEAA